MTQYEPDDDDLRRAWGLIRLRRRRLTCTYEVAMRDPALSKVVHARAVTMLRERAKRSRELVDHKALACGERD